MRLPVTILKEAMVKQAISYDRITGAIKSRFDAISKAPEKLQGYHYMVTKNQLDRMGSSLKNRIGTNEYQNQFYRAYKHGVPYSVRLGKMIGEQLLRKNEGAAQKLRSLQNRKSLFAGEPLSYNMRMHYMESALPKRK